MKILFQGLDSNFAPLGKGLESEWKFFFASLIGTALARGHQEAGTEFRRDDATWHVSHDKETCLAVCARKSAVESFTHKQGISHLDGTNKGSQCFTGVQITKVVLKKQNTLSHKAVICINCHFHHCTAKKQEGGGFRASFDWFFSYVTSCFDDFAKLNDGSAGQIIKSWKSRVLC